MKGKGREASKPRSVRGAREKEGDPIVPDKCRLSSTSQQETKRREPANDKMSAGDEKGREGSRPVLLSVWVSGQKYREAR